MIHLGTFASRLREARHLTLDSLARRLDIANATDLESFEATGEAEPNFIDAIRELLRVAHQDWDEITDILKFLARVPRRRKPVALRDPAPSRVVAIREFVRLFADFTRTHDTAQALIARLVAYTGVYPEELCRLARSDFEPRKNRLRIATADGGEVIFGRVFSAIIDFHAANFSGEKLFVSASGKPLTAGRVRQIARKVGK